MSSTNIEFSELPVPELCVVKLGAVIFDESLYPRASHDPALVQRYAETIEQIEGAQKFIALTPDFRLLDGKHRWLAYRTAYPDAPDREIQAFVYPVTTREHQYAAAVELNSTHGYQLDNSDKQRSAIRLYELGFSQETISAKLSISKSKVSAYLSRTVKEQRDRTNATIMRMWLAYYTNQEIADACGLTEGAIRQRSEEIVEKYRQYHSTKLAFADDFDQPLYNVWKQQEKSSDIKHFGNSEARWVENLLYLYTEPFDVVVDPFAGGGSTIDVCKRRGRRYFVSDRKPIVARADEIRKHDLTNGLPPLHRWSDVRLVYLDPPYWLQAAGEYSNDPTDLANMSLDQFHDMLAKIIRDFAAKLKQAKIALILQPTQWKAPDRKYTDHVAEMIRRVNLPLDMRIQAPYESQQANAQMVNWAKENRKILVLSREIVVWDIA